MENKPNPIGKLTAQIEHQGTATTNSENSDLSTSSFGPSSTTLDPSLTQILRDKTGMDVSRMHVRSMWIVSDEVNSYGGVLTSDTHAQIAELMIGAPILVGHQTDSLPIARLFHATVSERDGHSWVRAYFYWLREADGAETLRANIDGGVYQECSISFLYTKPVCLLCHQDVRDCGHEPNRVYRLHGRRQLCSFRYDGISKVLECSLVYRGAIPNTLVTQASLADGSHADIQETVISHLNELPAGEWFVVTPRYDGIRVAALIDPSSGEIILHAQQESLDEISIPIRKSEQSTRHASGLLVGYRNRSRVSREQLTRAVCGEESEVTRIVLYLLPQTEKSSIPQSSHPRFEIRTMPHASVHRSQLESKIAALSSRHGVEMWSWSSDEHWSEVFQFVKISDHSMATENVSTQANLTHRHVLQFSAVQCARFHSGNMFMTQYHDELPPANLELRDSNGNPLHSDAYIWQRIRRNGATYWGIRLGNLSRHAETQEGNHADCN